MAWQPTVAWIGVGAIGLLYAARLARAGVRPHLLLRSDYDAARSAGITVRSIDGDFHVPPGSFHAYSRARDMPRADLIVISTKTTAHADLPGLLAPLLHPRTRVLTLQNGLGNEDRLAGCVPAENILGGTAFVSVHRVGPATVDHQHAGRLAIGLHAPTRDAGKLTEVAELLRRTGFPIDELASLRFGRWEKQLWNVPFNCLGAAMLADTAALLRTEAGRGLVREVMAEVEAVAAADGHPLPPAMPEAKIRYTMTMGPYRTSMQLDREAGRPMEIEAILGSVTRIAKSHNLSVPRLETLQLLLESVDKAT